MLSEIVLKQTSLYKEHLRLNAKMVPFGGWDMPLQYEGILAEYEATRKAVTVFDTSHMGEFLISGEQLSLGLNRLVTQKLDDLKPGQCRYGALLNDEGKVLDDLIVYRLADRWMVVVNGATMTKDAEHFSRYIEPAIFKNISFETGKIDVQGPGSRDLLAQFIPGIEQLSYYTFAELEVLGIKAIVSRTGYTGELGYEIYYPWNDISRVFERVLKGGAKPAGLGSRDVLRLEMGYSLYGHELSDQITPLEAGLDRFIDWDKDFIGKDALLKMKAAGVPRQIVAVISDSRRSPRSEHSIFTVDGQDIGVITSGTYSPALERGIGLGLVRGTGFAKGSPLLVGDQKNKFAVSVASRPFYKKGTFRQ